MAYTPTTWQTGDTITAALLNKAEQGIAAAGPLVVHGTYLQDVSGMTLDKTWQEIYTAVTTSGVLGYMDISENDVIHYQLMPITEVIYDVNYDDPSKPYIVIASDYMLVTSSANGYPTILWEG